MKIKKILFLTIPLLAFMLLACEFSPMDDSDDTEDTESRQETDAEEVYSNEAHGFEITYPNGWVVEESDDYGNIVAFYNPHGDEAPGYEPFHANIGILSENAQGLDLDEYLETSREMLLDMFPDLEYTNVQDLEINGSPARLIELSYSYEGTDSIVYQLITIQEDEAYVITATSAVFAWEDRKDMLRESLLTFDFN